MSSVYQSATEAFYVSKKLPEFVLGWPAPEAAQKEYDTLYQKAFYENDYGTDNPYCTNTTAWD